MFQLEQPVQKVFMRYYFYSLNSNYCFKIVINLYVHFNFQSVLSMLESGENPNQYSDDGFTPLCLASFWGKADIVKSLLNFG